MSKTTYAISILERLALAVVTTTETLPSLLFVVAIEIEDAPYRFSMRGPPSDDGSP